MNSTLPPKITSEEIERLLLITLRQLRAGEINVREAGELRKIGSLLLEINAHRELERRLERIERVMSYD